MLNVVGTSDTLRLDGRQDHKGHHEEDACKDKRRGRRDNGILTRIEPEIEREGNHKNIIT